jgi:hypothetical protein
MYAKRLGDRDRAREELQTIVDKYARSEDAHLRRYATNAKQRLARL